MFRILFYYDVVMSLQGEKGITGEGGMKVRLCSQILLIISFAVGIGCTTHILHYDILCL